MKLVLVLLNFKFCYREFFCFLSSTEWNLKPISFVDDTYGFDDNTDLYDPNMDVSIDETDRLIEDIENVQGNFEDALTKAQEYFRVPFENTPEVGLEKKSEMMSDMIVERDEIPIKLVEIEIDHNLVPNNTVTDFTDSNSESYNITMKTFTWFYIMSFLYFSDFQ